MYHDKFVKGLSLAAPLGARGVQMNPLNGTKKKNDYNIFYFIFPVLTLKIKF